MKVLLPVSIILVLAAIYDIRFKKIPNWITYPGMILGIGYQSLEKGFEGVLFGIEGLAVGIGIFLIPYFIGSMGAGDAKLMGAVGGFLGPKGVFIAFLFTSIIGCIYALLLLSLYGGLKEIVKKYGMMLKALIITKQMSCVYIPEGEGKPKKLCYGLAIGLGTVLSVLLGNVR